LTVTLVVMKTTLLIWLVLSAIFLCAHAQEHAAAAAEAGALPDQSPITLGSRGLYVFLRSNVLKAAQKMPEENYSFQPTPEIRTFARLVGHVADAQYLFCSLAAGEKNPDTASIEKTKSTKAELVAALEESYAYCDKTYNAMNDVSGRELVKFQGRDVPKLVILNLNTAHLDEHYGNIVTYMRLKGLVPPSSEPPARK